MLVIAENSWQVLCYRVDKRNPANAVSTPDKKSSTPDTKMVKGTSPLILIDVSVPKG